MADCCVYERRLIEILIAGICLDTVEAYGVKQSRIVTEIPVRGARPANAAGA